MTCTRDDIEKGFRTWHGCWKLEEYGKWHKAIKGDVWLAAPDLLYPSMYPGGWPTQTSSTGSLTHCVPLMGVIWRWSKDGRRVRLRHLLTSPSRLLVVEFLLQRAWLLSDFTLFTFLDLSLSLPFKLRGCDRLPLLPKWGCHHSLLVSLNFAHTFLNSPFINLFLVNPTWVCHLFPARILGLTQIVTIMETGPARCFLKLLILVSLKAETKEMMLESQWKIQKKSIQ